MEIEYEATFPNIIKDEIRNKLIELGAKLIKKEFLMKRSVFTLPKNNEIDNAWLRVRDESDRITMSLKVIDGNQIHNQKEVCLNIDHFSDAELFLTTLGCKKIIINTHYLHDKVQHCIERYYSDRNIIISYEPTLLNTGGGVKNALSSLGNNNFIVTNSDILWKENNSEQSYSDKKTHENNLDEQFEYTLEECYDILGLKNDATTQEIKKAYQQLALQWHPDNGLRQSNGHSVPRRSRPDRYSCRVECRPRAPLR